MAGPGKAWTRRMRLAYVALVGAALLAASTASEAADVGNQVVLAGTVAIALIVSFALFVGVVVHLLRNP